MKSSRDIARRNSAKLGFAADDRNKVGRRKGRVLVLPCGRRRKGHVDANRGRLGQRVETKVDLKAGDTLQVAKGRRGTVVGPGTGGDEGTRVSVQFDTRDDTQSTPVRFTTHTYATVSTAGLKIFDGMHALARRSFAFLRRR